MWQIRGFAATLMLLPTIRVARRLVDQPGGRAPPHRGLRHSQRVLPRSRLRCHRHHGVRVAAAAGGGGGGGGKLGLVVDEPDAARPGGGAGAGAGDVPKIKEILKLLLIKDYRVKLMHF